MARIAGSDEIIRMLEEKGIPYSLIEHKRVFSIAELDEIDADEKDSIVKNIVLCDDKKKSFFLLTIPPHMKVDIKALRTVLSSRPLSFFAEERLHALLKIGKGEVVALLGENGAGKSTIASLLARFYELDGGKITIDGMDISKVTQKSLHDAIGFVRQDVFLFDASIRENLRYGKSDATDEELYIALDKANLLEFVKSLPQGLDTEVGERGTRLSGGQKQRLSIARCFLKNPPIIVFDEATSSLDTESEALIEESFMKLSAGRTTIVIAHRLSTVIDSDIIFVIDDGVLGEVGDHRSLMEKGGIYSRLYKKGSSV